MGQEEKEKEHRRRRQTRRINDKRRRQNKESSIEVKLEKKKNFDSVIEPIKNEDKNKRRKTHIFLGGTPREFTNARGVYIYIKGADQNVRAISLPQRRVCLLFFYVFVDEQEADREEQHRTTPKCSDDDDDEEEDAYQSSGCLVCF